MKTVVRVERIAPRNLGLRSSTSAATTRRGPAGRDSGARIAQQYDQGL